MRTISTGTLGARRNLRHGNGEFPVAADLVALDGGDHIAGLQPCVRRRRIVLDAGDQRAALITLGMRQVQRVRHGGRNALRLHPDIAARDMAGLLQLCHHALHRV